MSSSTVAGASDPEKLQPIPPAEHTVAAAPPSPTLTATERIRSNTSGRYASSHSLRSASRAREESHRKGDDIELMKAERVASQTSDRPEDIYRSVTTAGGGNRDVLPPESTVADSMDDVANPVHNTRRTWRPPKQPATKLAKLLKKVGWCRRGGKLAGCED
jgi:hypothetical protein